MLTFAKLRPSATVPTPHFSQKPGGAVMSVWQVEHKQASPFKPPQTPPTSQLIRSEQ